MPWRVVRVGRSPRDRLVWKEEEELEEMLLEASKELVAVISRCWQVQLEEQLEVHTVGWLWGGGHGSTSEGSFCF